MNDKEIAFSVQMTPVEIFKFTMYHSYHKLSGVIGILLSLVALIILICRFGDLNDQDRTILIIVALWFTVLEPLTLLSRAKSQVKRNKVYQAALEYKLDENGITVSQNDTEQTLAWDSLMKLVETKTQFLVYSSRIHAFIFPKKSIGEDCDAARELMLNYAKTYNIPVKGARKKKES